MADHPIIYSAPMVRALLGGWKTQTRRIITASRGAHAAWLRPDYMARVPSMQMCTLTAELNGAAHAGKHGAQMEHPGGGPGGWVRCPFGKPGDRLWVRESLKRLDDPGWVYRADGEAISMSREDPRVNAMIVWAHHKDGDHAPSIHMPRWASRLTLVVTDIRAQRLQDISEEDAITEGMQPAPGGWWSGAEGQSGTSPRAAFALLWNSLHARDYWGANPWVWALTFTVQHRNIDAPVSP